MVTVTINDTSVDLWVGDVVCASPGETTTTTTYKLASFFMQHGRLMAEAYEEATGFSLGSTVILDIVKNIQLPSHSHTNSTTHHPLKRAAINSNRQFMPVKIVPMNLFSDDTSGNTTKKWNKFESWVLSPAAMPFKEQNGVENMFFLCTSNKLSAVEMLPDIVKDLKALERGMVMFDVEFGESVLVVGVLHFIMADNPMHAAIACSLGPKARLPCRKCHWINERGSGAVEQEGDAPARTKEELVEMHQHCINNPNNTSLKTNTSTGCKLTGGEALLSLQSWDPSKDCPVEILHTVLLGVAKSLVIGMVPFLTEAEVKHLEESFFNYNSKAFKRNHHTPFRRCGSYLGRDYKTIVQQMPTILNHLIQDRLITMNSTKAIIFDCFVKLGSLVSLLYMQRVETSLHVYLDNVESVVGELTGAIAKYDKVAALGKSTKKPKTGSTLKMHLLSHLCEDISRFAPPVHYETERGEQFNKFIRERIIFTNRRSPSRDVAVSFGKKYMSVHVFQGGYWHVPGYHGLLTAGAEVKLSQEMRPLTISRELVDNNSSSKSIVVGLAGLFSFSSGASPIFGKIVAIEKGNMVIVPYNFHLATGQNIPTHPQHLASAKETHNFSSLFALGVKDNIISNVIFSLSTTIEVELEDVVVEEVVDIVSMNGYTSLNVSKFGSLFWTMTTRVNSVRVPQ